MFIKNIFIILFLLLPGGLYAVTTVPDDLTVPLDLTSARNEWKFKPGDDLQYRLPRYDDSSWETIGSLPHNWKNLRIKPHSTAYSGWYRIHLRFGNKTHGKPLMFRLGPIDDADEVYFNGILIGKMGEIDRAGKTPKGHAWDRVRLYPVIPGIESAGRDNVLAVRVQAYFDNFAGMYYDGGKTLLGYDSGIFYGFLIENIGFLVFVIVIIMVGLYCLLLFFLRSSSRENLYFGLSCLLFGVYFTFSSSIKNFIPYDFLLMKRIEFICLFPVITVFADFIYMFFHQNTKKAWGINKYLLLLNNILAGVSVLVPLISDDFLFWWWFFNHIVIFIWAFSLLQILWIIIDNLLKKNRDAYYMLAGVIIGLVTLGNDALSIYALLPWGRFGHIGYFTFIIFLGIVLAYRYVRTQQEITRLNTGLEQLVRERTGELRITNDALVERTTELSRAYANLHERNIVMEDELEIARLIMEKILPRKEPDRKGYVSHMTHIPMDKVGGDFYHYCEKGDTIELMIADVSGHGLPGAFLSLITKMALENATGTIPATEMMSLLNETVCRATVKSNYITSFFCLIDTVTNVMSFANAGHFPQLVYRPRDCKFIELNARGNPLGLFQDLEVEEKTIRLLPGDRMVLFTDGIIECLNPGREMYGFERLKEFIAALSGDAPSCFAQKLVDDLKSFTGMQRFDDDLTLVVMDVL